MSQPLNMFPRMPPDDKCSTCDKEITHYKVVKGKIVGPVCLMCEFPGYKEVALGLPPGFFDLNG